MEKRNWLAVGVTGLLASAAFTFAQGPPAEAARTVRGTVDRFTTAPRGEVDGAALGDGTLVHWPPHVGERVSAIVKKGDQIEVTGRTETGPEGDSHFEVQSLKNLSSDATLDLAAIAPPAPGRGPGPRPRRENAERETVRGKIDRLTTAPRGEVDGAVLDGRAVIHWPPHLGERINKILAKGDRIEVIGHKEVNPEGVNQLEAIKITNQASNASLDVDDFGPPEGRRPPRGPARRPGGESRTVRGTVDRLTTAPRGEVDGAVLNDGTIIHWPPHLEKRYKEHVRVGQRLDVTGQTETGPEGEKRFEVERLTSLTDDGATAAPEASETPASRDALLRDLQKQLDRIQQQLDRLRGEG